MRAVRHNDLSPRFEMTPLIDIIFLLLTFFIYSMVMMKRTEAFPMTLAALGTGQAEESLQVLTIDRAGKIRLNQDVIAPAQLDARLRELAAQQPQPRVFVGMEAQGDVDRGPLFLDLIGRLRQSGITPNIIGQPAAGTGP